MKTQPVRCAIFIAILVSAGFTQTADRQITLDLGHVTVWLGMPEQETRKRFSSAGYKVIDAPLTVAPLTVVTDGVDAYLVRFKQGRLIYASRGWYNSKQGDELDAILGALGALADKAKNADCTVAHDSTKNPDTSYDRIFVWCGDRSVRIGKGKIGGKEVLDIAENIGEAPPD
jgi:hypothetical protein